jgi:hypothetical protein
MARDASFVEKDELGIDFHLIRWGKTLFVDAEMFYRKLMEQLPLSSKAFGFMEYGSSLRRLDFIEWIRLDSPRHEEQVQFASGGEAAEALDRSNKEGLLVY